MPPARRLPGMNQHRTRRLGVGLLSLALLLVACSAAAAPSTSPRPSGPPDAPVTAPPTNPADPSLDPGGIGDGAKVVVPKPGQLDVHDVSADSLAARVDGSTIIVTATWFSGVEPCSILDQIVVTKGDGSYAITLREGHGPQDVACIAIAELHKTEIAIPDVAPGTYQITDGTGGAAPIEVTVG
jgi:ABC-type transport system substrate-binding protein